MGINEFKYEFEYESSTEDEENLRLSFEAKQRSQNDSSKIESEASRITKSFFNESSSKLSMAVFDTINLGRQLI